MPHKQRGVECASCDVYDPAPRRVAIVKLAAVGDVLRTTSFLPGIRRMFQDARVDWLTQHAAVSLFEGNPLVDGVHATDGTVLPALLAATPFDVVICPDADPVTAALAAGLSLRDGGQRIGFGFEDGHVVPLSDAARHWYLLGLSDARKKANQETYQNLVGAVVGLPLPVQDRPVFVVSAGERARAQAWLGSCDGGHGRPLVGLNTGAGRRWPRKQWTLDGQVGLIRFLDERGYRVVLLGGPEEVERHRALVASAPAGACLDAGNDNTLRDFAARLDLCELLVTGDTMALHLGCALAKPIVALFGPTSSAEIELYGTGTKVFAEQLDCLVCYSTCDRTPSCQELISLDMVLAALIPQLEAVHNR